jgi:hypothetical protein
MGIFDGTGLDPKFTPSDELWATTRDELKERGLEIHGGFSSSDTNDGATGIVLKATETASDRTVAIKVYKHPQQVVGHRNGDTVSMSNFFENERRMLAGLQDCPEIPSYHYSVDSASAQTRKDIQPFHVQEFIDGQRVTKFAKETLSAPGKQRPEQVVDLFLKVLKAVESIHQFGYLHRDISDGNVMVDKQGRIRLIDVAEASPLGEEHTRLVSTPGLGTEGIASTAQQQVRAIQTDDVHAVCTIGYALFTGRWKQDGELPADWQRNMIQAGAPKRIAQILIKGMRTRDTNQQVDPLVWNTCQEVIVAIESHRASLTNRRKTRRWALVSSVVTVLVIVVAVLTLWHVQSNTFLAELNELEQQRTELAKQPQRNDVRVTELVNQAEKLEQSAHQAQAARNTTEALRELDEAQAMLVQAVTLAADLDIVGDLVAPLQTILDKDYWHTDCPAIRTQHSKLLADSKSIKQEIAAGDPRAARRQRCRATERNHPAIGKQPTRVGRFAAVNRVRTTDSRD